MIDERVQDILAADREGLPSDAASSIGQDGSRRYVHPADVKGRYTRLRRLLFAGLILIYALLPWVHVGGRPAMFLDIERRRFYLFGATFNSQDFWLAFFLLSGVGFLLVVAAALLGRVWCGYACPQTVFLEGVFRRIERGLEGPRARRLRRNAAPWTFDKLWRKSLKHVVYLLVSLIVAHIFLSYFVSLPAMLKMVAQEPAQHPQAFAWTMGLSAAMYFNFAWFREQLCLVICPYGRLQSVLTDKDSIVVGYDGNRGEPRGKASDPQSGDCIDCQRCVTVCPTGIDIRNGLQIDCIGCAACIDACDEIMDRVGRPKGLVRYDSFRGLSGNRRRFWRPRLVVYGILGLAGLAAFALSLQRHQPFEANLVRMSGVGPFVIDGTRVRNALELHVVNKFAERRSFRVSTKSAPGDPEVVVALPTFDLPALGDRRVSVLATRPLQTDKPGGEVRIEISVVGGTDPPRVLRVPFLHPKGAAGAP